MYGRTEEEKKVRRNTQEELLRYGKYLIDNTFETKLGVYRVRIIYYAEHIYFHKMRNGEVLEIKDIAKLEYGCRELELEEKMKCAVDRVYEVLHDLGYSPRLRGYKYIVDAIKYCIVNKDAMKFVKGSGYNVYGYVAELHKTNRANARKCIDKAVNESMNNISYSKAEKYLGGSAAFSKGTITSVEVIAQIAEYLKNEVQQNENV